METRTSGDTDTVEEVLEEVVEETVEEAVEESADNLLTPGGLSIVRGQSHSHTQTPVRLQVLAIYRRIYLYAAYNLLLFYVLRYCYVDMLIPSLYKLLQLSPEIMTSNSDVFDLILSDGTAKVS